MAWDDTVYVVIFAVTTLAVYLSCWWNVRQFSRRGVPCSWPVPLLGNNAGLLWGKVMSCHVVDLYNKFRGRPFAGVFEFTLRVIMIRDPEVVKLVTVKDFDHFVDHRATLPENVEPLLERNLINLKGTQWKTIRNILTPSFTSSKMKFLFQLVTECGKQLARHVDEQINEQGGAILEINAKDLYTRYTNDAIATTAFGISCNSLQDTENEFYIKGRIAATVTAKMLLSLVVFMSFPRLGKLLKLSLGSKEAHEYFRGLILDTIRTREEKNIVRPDMIHLMMEAKKLNKDLTDEDIAAQAFLFFSAGFDTTSTLLCFATILLAVHPEVQEKLLAEVDHTFNDGGQTITYEALHGMTYLDMVISETLRLYPPLAMIDRKCVKAYTVPATESRPGLQIEKDELIMIPVVALHKDPDYFPDPDSFQPERFSEENKHNIRPFTYLPFGLGPRSCIGNRLALMEAKVALVHLLSRFSFDVIDKTPLPIKVTNTMDVQGGCWLGLRPRKKTR